MLALSEMMTYFDNDIQEKYSDFLKELNNEKYYLSTKTEIIEAVIKFNIALLILDEEPKSNNLETHVLYSDLLMTEFYTTMAKHNHYKILFDIVMLTKQSITKKSNFFNSNNDLRIEDKKHLFFAPIEYLITNGFLNESMNRKIEDFLDNGENNER